MAARQPWRVQVWYGVFFEKKYAILNSYSFLHSRARGCGQRRSGGRRRSGGKRRSSGGKRQQVAQEGSCLKKPWLVWFGLVVVCVGCLMNCLVGYCKKILLVHLFHCLTM